MEADYFYASYKERYMAGSGRSTERQAVPPPRRAGASMVTPPRRPY